MKIGNVLVVCLVFSVIFSTNAVANFLQDTSDICDRVFLSLNVFQTVNKYGLGHISQARALERLYEARDLTFKDYMNWTVLDIAERGKEELGSLDKVVRTFFAARIGGISYAIYMIEAGKIRGEKPDLELKVTLAAALGLALVELDAYKKVKVELEEIPRRG